MRKKKTATQETVEFPSSAIPIAPSPPGFLESVQAQILRDTVQAARLYSGRFVGVDPSEAVKPPAIDIAKLGALKNTEPHKVCKRAPDMISVITAWRAWDVKLTAAGWRLDALGKHCVWEPRKAISAKCLKQSLIPISILESGGPKHPAPQMNCDCGVWAFKTLDGLVSAAAKYNTIRVIGNVSLWGRVIETENGYRAEKAYPAELWLLDNSLEELGLIYDVPVRMA